MPLAVLAANIGDGTLLYRARLPCDSRVPAGVLIMYLLGTRIRAP